MVQSPNQTITQPRRKALGRLLKSFLPEGAGAVYFQKPGNLKMEYPAILYKQNRLVTRHANNVPYSQEKGWLVTIIDRDPDSTIPDMVASLPKSTFDRQYEADGLIHTVYALYF